MGEMLAVMAVIAVVAIIFVIPIIILLRLNGLCNGMEELRRRMLNMDRTLAALPERSAIAPPDLVASVMAVAAAERPPPVMQQAEPIPEAAPQPLVEVAAVETPVPEAAPSAFETAMTKLWNWLIIGEEFRKPGESWEYAAATNWLMRVGILIVLAGVAFFLKYSIEKGLMGPLGRVTLSLAAGILLIVGGVRLLFKKYHLLGQGFVGAGFVTLYFAFYAAASMYRLLPDAAAFALMACVTVAAGVMAVNYQSLPIALLGVAGGYATPAMLGSSHASVYFFYAYVLLLGIGILGISLMRRWPLLNVLGMLAAYGLAFAYCARHHTHTQLFFDLLFLSGIHLLYLLSVIVMHL
ncbi:MAG: DUF2339 domain-containing protein, partial [Kiritimatiellae bacterium]|nr:DUF2339 domain-containing protein [Kiritimatiellia bacterium]